MIIGFLFRDRRAADQDKETRGSKSCITLTIREFLYHLPCESSARKLESFRSRWLASETAMRADRVVMPPPAFCQNLCFLERREQFAIEKLIPHLAIQ